jgi:hypothetical protein
MTHDEIYQAGYDQGFAHGVSEGRSATVLRYAERDRLEVARLMRKYDEEQAAIFGRLGTITEIELVEATNGKR